MSATAETSPTTAPQSAESLRLRTRLPPVNRLSPRVLGTLAVLGIAALTAALIYGLQGRDKVDPPAAAFDGAKPQPAESLSKLPKDYSQVPKLGPPLPGDFGRPLLNSQAARSSLGGAPGAGPRPEDAARQQRLQQLRQEQEAARTAKLFAGIGSQQNAIPPTLDAPRDTGNNAASPNAAPAGGAPKSSEDHRLAFLSLGRVAGPTVSTHRLEAPVSRYLLQAGSTIPAALVTGIRSDLPGQVIAVVTQTVTDSISGRIPLIPQGAKLIGRYNARIDAGQRRVLLVWDRLILPNGQSLTLNQLPAGDAAGFAGLEDRVDYHWERLAKAAGLSTLLNLGLELGNSGEGDIARAIRQSGQNTVGRTGEAIIQREVQTPPTLTIRAGFQLAVMVTRDLVLEPWEDRP
jgi:type IV secretion system protein TrbI